MTLLPAESGPEEGLRADAPEVDARGRRDGLQVVL
jgi:hypothetical protein